MPRDGLVVDCADAPPRHRIDRPNARTATLPALPPLWPMTAGQSLASGVKGDTGQRHVDDQPPPSDRLRRAATDCHRAAGPRARLLGTRWRYPPAGGRLGARIAGIDAAENPSGTDQMQDEIALDRSAMARARTLLDGRPVTIRRVGARPIFRASATGAAPRNRPPRSGRGSPRSCPDVRRCNGRSGDSRPRRRHSTAPRPRR